MTSRQARSSLGFVADATTIRLSDGSISVNANSLTASNLQPSTTMKTDASRNIVSADLFLSDIKDYVPPAGSQVFNPMTSDLDADGKDIINVGNLETTLINSRGVLYNQSIANLNMANFNINNTNNINLQTINSKTPLYNPSTTNLDMGNFNINNNPQITSLTQKTQFITANEEFKEVQFTGGVLVNGNISNTSDILFENGASINGVETDLSISVPGIGAITTDNNLISTGNITCNTITADNVNIPAISTLQTKTQNIIAVANNTTFTGIAEVKSDFKVNGISTLVGGITANQKITLTKNVLEIQEDNVYTKAIEVGDLLTTGYSFPRTNGATGQELRLGTGNALGWYSPSTYIRFNRNTTLGTVTLLTSPIATRISIFPGLITESTSVINVFTTTVAGARYNSADPRKAFQVSFNALAYITNNPANGNYDFRIIHRKFGPPVVEAVLAVVRIMMATNDKYTISLQAVGFDLLINDVIDVSIEGSVASTIKLDSQQVSIIAH
jgi:hypothetical protein